MQLKLATTEPHDLVHLMLDQIAFTDPEPVQDGAFEHMLASVLSMDTMPAAEVIRRVRDGELLDGIEWAS